MFFPCNLFLFHKMNQASFSIIKIKMEKYINLLEVLESRRPIFIFCVNKIIFFQNEFLYKFKMFMHHQLLQLFLYVPQSKNIILSLLLLVILLDLEILLGKHSNKYFLDDYDLNNLPVTTSPAK